MTSPTAETPRTSLPMADAAPRQDAGIDYELLQGMARTRSLQTRRRNRRRAVFVTLR